jgi:hypothetical protein
MLMAGFVSGNRPRFAIYLGPLPHAAKLGTRPTRGRTGMGESRAGHRQPLLAQVEGGRGGEPDPNLLDHGLGRPVVPPVL